MPILKDLTGQRFGRLTVIMRAENIGKKTAWLCQCDCGNTKIVSGSNLHGKQVMSCGCLGEEVRAVNCESRQTHGQSYTRLYTIWIGMKQRCFYKKHKHFKRYGGRGITVCDEWKDSFESFYKWAMENGYSDELTIDRIDVNGNYCPENCRWATYKEQNNNTSSSHFLTYNGETKTVAEWSEIVGIPKSTIFNRIKRGLPTEKVLKRRR